MSALSRSSFHGPMQLLSRPRRHALQALYAFCRAADDAVDGSCDISASRQSLAHLRRLASGELPDAAPAFAPAFLQAQRSYGLNPHHLHALLDGQEMDLDGKMIAPCMETLLLYCHRVAGCVGLLSLPIFGSDSPQDRQFALALGHALQLTNILRDLREDAERGRLYLPREWLEAEGITVFTPAMMDFDAPAVKRVCKRMAQRALDDFAGAHALSLSCHRRRLLPALLMRDIYRMKLDRLIREDNFSAAPPHRFSLWQYGSLLCRALYYTVALKSQFTSHSAAQRPEHPAPHPAHPADRRSAHYPVSDPA